ncbi:type 1 glutamine amidotransferase [Janibacter alittae]|uniref:Type 1 glutamine amidotransferase n=1 Tax=Janibacter alittae TaxID=3115209 RepID=A0ABZ2MI79_9MICO
MAVLVVQHQRTCPPGRLGDWLTDADVDLDVRHPYAGDPLPHDLSGHDGLIVLGGQMGHADDAAAPWLSATRGLIRTAAKGAVPTLGICLGHQLAASALGGTVARNPRGRTLGMFSVLGSAGLSTDPVLEAAEAAPVVQWNDDIVTELPTGATALAVNACGDLLLARLAPTVWGVQGHPEADHDIVADWASKDAGTTELADVDVPAVLTEIEGSGPAVEAAWRPVATAFAAVLRR